MTDYKIEIRDQWSTEEKFSLVPQEIAYEVVVYINGEQLRCHSFITSMEKAGAIALYYETFLKYYKQN